MKFISFREHSRIVCLKNYFMQEAFDRNWKINWSHFHFIQESVAIIMRLLHQYGSFLASCSSRSSSSRAPPVHSYCLPPVSNYEAAARQVFWLCNLGGGCCFSRASECSRAVGKNGKTLGNSLGLQNNKKVMKGFKASSVQPPAGDEADVYAAISPTLSRAAASVLEVGDLNGNACHLLDKSKKEQVYFWG